MAFSRTDPQGKEPAIREIEQLFVDAIEAAERLIYVETQYFSSRIIYDALVTRMRAAGRSRLEIVVVVNERAEALKEELAVGLRQAKILEGLRQVARSSGHALGLYYSLCDGDHDTFRATYIHSKLIVVDDRFLTVGSANLTNRSMGVDSELHASWEARSNSPVDQRLVHAIRGVRVNLLAEHGGLSGAAMAALVPIENLVARLDGVAGRPEARLRSHDPPTPTQQAVLEFIDPEDLPFDPDGPESADAAGREEPADEPRKRGRTARRGTLGTLWRRFRPSA